MIKCHIHFHTYNTNKLDSFKEHLISWKRKVKAGIGKYMLNRSRSGS